MYRMDEGAWESIGLLLGRRIGGGGGHGRVYSIAFLAYGRPFGRRKDGRTQRAVVVGRLLRAVAGGWSASEGAVACG